MSKFIARFDFRRPSPGRLYLSDCSLEKFFGKKIPIEKARKYAAEVIGSLERSIFLKADYLLGVIWGDDEAGERAIDLFGYSGIKNWPGNPEVSAWPFKGKYPVDKVPIICGNGLMLLGQVEEPYRRTTQSLDEYLRNPPALPESFGKLKVERDLFGQ